MKSLHVLGIAGVAGLVCLLGCSKNAAPNTCATQPTPDAPTTLDLNTGLNQASLQSFVGRQVKVIGFWCGGGKPGEFVYGEQNPDTLHRPGGAKIYLESWTDRGLKIRNQWLQTIDDQTPVELTGVLRYDRGWMPKTDPAHPNEVPATQPDPAHFYFDAENLNIQVIKR